MDTSQEVGLCAIFNIWVDAIINCLQMPLLLLFPSNETFLLFRKFFLNMLWLLLLPQACSEGLRFKIAVAGQGQENNSAR